MKSFSKLGLAVATAALLVPGVARADDAGTRAGWYAGVGAMASFQLDADSDVGNVTNKLGYDAGWGLNGDVGYAWGNGFRAEGEVAYRRTGDVNSITGTGARTDGGHIRNISLMANGYYDFATGTRFTPYVGAGFGTSVVDAFNVRRVDGYTLDSERAEFAYQGMAGLAYSLDSHWVVTGEYRYFSTLSPKFKATDGVTRADTDNASHNFLVGIRYAFGQPETPAHAAPAPAPVAAPAVAPVAAPVVPAVPQSYMVFFDFDRASLTPEAKRIIASAAQEFKKGKYVRLVVTGNTDTVGSEKYNHKLSAKRADAVKAELASLGVPNADVKAVAAGKSNLLVPTADGVREAQNRRAEIVLSK